MPPPPGDLGTGTPAQTSGTIVQPTNDTNGGKRRVRLDPWRDDRGLGRHLNQRQRDTADRLHEAYAATQLAGGGMWTERVDGGGDPGAAAVLRTARLMAWGKLAKHIPEDGRGVVLAVVCHGVAWGDVVPPGPRCNQRRLVEAARLARALSAVADAMGWG